MQIHIVKSNESLTTIARAYNTTVNDIVEANDIPNPNNLVVGQAMVIPIVGSFYYVQPGDSLWSIGQKVGVPYQQIASANRISLNQQLYVGFRLYIPQAPKRRAEFNAYVEPRGTSVAPILRVQRTGSSSLFNLPSSIQLSSSSGWIFKGTLIK